MILEKVKEGNRGKGKESKWGVARWAASGLGFDGPASLFANREVVWYCIFLVSMYYRYQPPVTSIILSVLLFGVLMYVHRVCACKILSNACHMLHICSLRHRMVTFVDLQYLSLLLMYRHSSTCMPLSYRMVAELIELLFVLITPCEYSYLVSSSDTVALYHL